jgi:aryl-alcohol dehydrogenase-like predicted oxidoreductase
MSQIPLATRELGRTGLGITRLGIGAWAVGGGSRSGRGPEEEWSIAAVHRALDAGVNWIETTADDRRGYSEEIVGRALHGWTDRPFVFTRRTVSQALARTSPPNRVRDILLDQVEASIKRLRADAIDLYQIDSPHPERHIERVWAALAELKEQGIVRHIGVCNFDVAQLRRAQRIAPVDVLRTPYSFIDRVVESEILPVAAREGVGVLTCSPMGSDVLTGAMNRVWEAQLADEDGGTGEDRSPEAQLVRHRPLLERLRRVAGRHDTTLGAVAIAWTLAHPAVDAAVVRFTRRDEVDPLLPAAGLELSPDDLTYLEDTAPC